MIHFCGIQHLDPSTITHADFMAQNFEKTNGSFLSFNFCIHFELHHFKIHDLL